MRNGAASARSRGSGRASARAAAGSGNYAAKHRRGDPRPARFHAATRDGGGISRRVQQRSLRTDRTDAPQPGVCEISMRTVFFDIDTQIDFMYPAGALYVPGAEGIVPAIQQLNQYARAHGIPVISTMDAHTEDDPEFKLWPHHCVAET